MAAMVDYKGASKNKREDFARLSGLLEDWGTLAFPHKSFEWYTMLKQHGILPFAGAYEDQPRYVQLDLMHWTILERWHTLNSELKDASDLPKGIGGAQPLQ